MHIYDLFLFFFSSLHPLLCMLEKITGHQWSNFSYECFPIFPPESWRLFMLLVTGVVQRSVFVQGEERRVEQHSVVVLHDDPLVLCLDPWFVLIG